MRRLCAGATIFFKLTILAAFPSHSTAQTSVWNTPEKASSGAKKTLSKTAGTVKRWKNHLEKWGLDTTYNHAVGLTGRLNTNGWTVGLFYQKPKGSIRDRRRGKNAGKSDIWSLTFSEVTHEKQAKQHKENTSFPELGESEPFVFGKINNLYLLQLGYSREQLLLPGVLDGNISVSFRYGGGFSLAMLKPYYLKLMYVEYTPDQIVTLNEERYSPETKKFVP